MRGTRVPKKRPAKRLRHRIAEGFGGLKAMQPVVHGRVQTMYDIMRISCQS